VSVGILGVLALGGLSFGGLLGATPGVANFDSTQPGTVPANWSVGSGTQGSHPWVVRSDATAPSRGNVLESSPQAEDSPVAVFDPVTCRDGELSVKFRIDPKAPGGVAGIVWRYVDDKNYYLLAFDATKKVISLFRVTDGVQRPVPDRTGRPKSVVQDIRAGEWHVAKVSFRGTGIRVYFGNRRLFDANDAALPRAGKTGVVTGGATTAAFDDFRIDKKS